MTEPITLLSRDLKEAAATLTTREVRCLVDGYYMIQEYRKASGNQIRALTKSDEPHAVLDWLFEQNKKLEAQIVRALNRWTDESPISRWSKSIVGIGPVISAGLAAHIDITKAPTAGHIWRFAGLDPTLTWQKNQKRPWNAQLKTLCWKLGESFVKVSNHPDDFYGRLYTQRKEYEIANNSAGKLAEQAKYKLENFNIGKDKKAYQYYKEGLLPPDHIHSRAKRWVVKLFLAHYQQVAYKLYYGVDPPRPYVIEHLGHVDMILPPNYSSL